jgi:hypothetical protein
MDEERDGFHEDPGWVASADHLDPVIGPAGPPPRRHRRDARRALALAIVGVACFGFVLGPLALILGQRTRFAMIVDRLDRGTSEPGDAAVVHAAITLGKVGLALHLAILASVIPWLLFALPLVWGAPR